MKRKISFLFVFLCSLLLSEWCLAQQSRISGKVTNKQNGAALPFATVSVGGSDIAVKTDEQGSYQLAVSSFPVVISASYAGYKTADQTIAAAGTVNFELEEGSGVLEDVVVVGYGTQKITKVSGAIGTVKAADIEKINAVRTEEALQGRVSGVNVIQSGSPGSKPTVLIRGIPSFSGTDPVVIIDGVPQSLTDLNSINAMDIESINVLKDAATTAIYGVKGGNGVIVVTTKTGRKNQKPEVTLNTNYGVQQVMNTIGVLNATEYAAIINEGSSLAGGGIIFNDLSALGKGVNWQDEIFKTAPMQSHTLGVRGGSAGVSYFLSAGYLGQAGIVGGSDKSQFNRGNFTANIDFDISKRIKFLFNTTGVLLNSRGVQENSFNSIIGSALNFDPTVAKYNTNPDVTGIYGYSNLLLSEIFNPLTKLENTYNKNQGFKLYGKFELQYQPVKNLRFSSRFGYTKYDGNSRNFTPLVFYGPLNVENTMTATGEAVTGRFNQVSHEKASNLSYTWETFGNYNFSVNQHDFDMVAGISLAKVNGNTAGASRQNVPFNSWDFADFTAATGTNTEDNLNAIDGYYYQYFRRNLSYFGRVNYDFREKYLASFTARRDGSYAFGTENKFANFYSGSLGWVVSKEDFFNIDKISLLKLRGSYGSIGNENVSPQFVQIITGGSSYGPTANSNGYNFGDVFYPGSTVGSVANNALRWEKQLQMNIGFDLGLFNSKIMIAADYFSKSVDGLLFTPSGSLYLGTVPLPVANIGSTQSSGFDFSLSHNTSVSDFKIGNTLTFTTVTNKVTATNDDGTAKIFGGSYFNGQSQTVTVFEKDQSPGYFYGYKTLGIFQNYTEIANAPTQQGAQPGDIRFADVNQDGVISALDQTKIGDPFPDFTAGWNLSLQYKSVDFTVFTYASVGNDIYKAYERNANFSNKPRDILNRWTGEGTTNDARYPRYTFVDANSNIRVSDRYVEDGSFVKIKNLQLGYTLPRALVKNVLNHVRLYAQLKNAFTFTKYSGFDPEISGGILDTGVDRGAYPQARTYTIGLDIKFK